MRLIQTFRRAQALVRYHRWQQFAWRAWRIAQRKMRQRLPERVVFRTGRRSAAWKADAQAAYREIAQRRQTLWPGHEALADSIVQHDCFRFLNEPRRLRPPPGSAEQRLRWDVDAPRLWRFHLQCHEYLTAVALRHGADEAYALLASWLAEPAHQFPTRDADAWHPFCISRRLPVWLSLLASHAPPSTLAPQLWSSLADQIAWLRGNCEWDLGGNHLLENLTALYLAESFLEFEARRSRWSVEEALREQLGQQVLPSGEHFERAATYHALMLSCVLQCLVAAEFTGAGIRHELRQAATRMARFAEWIRTPDGKLPLLADSSRHDTPELDALLGWSYDFADPALACEPGRDYWRDGGRGSGHGGDWLLFKTGPVACDHLPAHGHCDLLQIVAYLGGCEAIVDTGNFDYEPSATRQFCRSTAAHNVLQLDEREQCDVWSSFRMGRRAKPRWRNDGRVGRYRWCAAAHDGFGALVGRIVLGDGQSWWILDWFDEPSASVARSRLHWHPDWSLERTGVGEIMATHTGEARLRCHVTALAGSGELEVERSQFYPGFGIRLHNQVAVLRSRHNIRQWLGVRISRLPLSVTDTIGLAISAGTLQVLQHPNRLLSLDTQTGSQTSW